MKLNKCFTTCYLLAFNTLYHPHTFINLSPHLYFPFPTESRPKRKRSMQVGRFFRVAADRQELALVRDSDARKKSPALAQDMLLLRSMMARGGQGCATSGSKSQNHINKPLRHLRSLFFTTWTTSSAFCPIYRYASSKKILLNISPIGSIDNVHQ